MKRRQKRRDYRYTDEHGETWDSKFEARVFNELRAPAVRLGLTLRRCVKPGDSVAYTTAIRGANCVECGSHEVVQRRTYTPDVHVCGSGREIWIEAKGYFDATKRACLRSLVKQAPDFDVRIVLAADHKAGKGTITEYITKYMKVPVMVLKKDGIPDDFLRKQ